MARWLAAQEMRPELVLCSPAVRARQTLELVLPALEGALVAFEDGLYGAGADELLARVHALPDDVGEALLVGHNPGLADLCLLLARPGSKRDRVAAKLPTGALVVLESDLAVWRELGVGTARLVNLVVPRELG